MMSKVLESQYALQSARLNEFAFTAIQRFAEIKHSERRSKMRHALVVFSLKYDKLEQDRLRFGLHTLNHFDKFHAHRHKRFGAICLNRVAVQLRHNFKKWAGIVARKQLRRENEEECGQTNLQAWRLRWQQIVLAGMVSKDGHC